MPNSNIICSICARGGSKGVKNKNIREINGKPLIAYTIEQAVGSNLCTQIVVSTDSEEISEIAISFGADVFFKRPSELALDTAAKIPVIRHALVESEKHYRKQFSTIIDLDVTSPLRKSEDIINAYNQFVQNNHENLITVAPSRRSPYFNMVEVANNQVKLVKRFDNSVTRRQDAPQCYDMNASIYIWRRETLLENDQLFLGTTGLYIMPEERSMDIDSELDFEIVEFLMRRKNV